MKYLLIPFLLAGFLGSISAKVDQSKYKAIAALFGSPDKKGNFFENPEYLSTSNDPDAGCDSIEGLFPPVEEVISICDDSSHVRMGCFGTDLYGTERYKVVIVPCPTDSVGCQDIPDEPPFQPLWLGQYQSTHGSCVIKNTGDGRKGGQEAQTKPPKNHG